MVDPLLCLPSGGTSDSASLGDTRCKASNLTVKQDVSILKDQHGVGQGPGSFAHTVHPRNLIHATEPTYLPYGITFPGGQGPPQIEPPPPGFDGVMKLV